MQLSTVLMLSAVVVVVTPMPTAVEKAERLLYNLLDRVLSLNRTRSVLKEDDENIVETAKDLGLTAFVESLDKVKLEETVSTKSPLTAMAPTNEAFENLPNWDKKRIEKDEKVLEEILKYHVIEKELKPSELRNDMLVPTLLGGDVEIRFNKYHNGKVITASGRPIKMDGHKATNGMLYEVGGVMIPPMGTIAAELKRCPAYKFLTMALEKANMQEMLNGVGPYTMFAPTDKAFEKIPKATLDSLMKDPAALKELLKYHIVPGTYYSAGLTDGDSLKTESGKTINIKMDDENLEVNTVPVSQKDITTTNGCVHAVESVLMPPTTRLVLVF